MGVAAPSVPLAQRGEEIWDGRSSLRAGGRVSEAARAISMFWQCFIYLFLDDIFLALGRIGLRHVTAECLGLAGVLDTRAKQYDAAA